MSNARAKGATVNFAVFAFKQLAGEARFAAKIAVLSDAAQELLRYPPAYTEWVPQPLCNELYNYAFTLFGESSVTMQKAGLIAAEQGLRSTYRIFVRALSPQNTIRGWPTIWAVITSGWGSAKLDGVEPGKATITMTGFPNNSNAVWHFIGGLLLGVVQMSGGKNCSSQIVSGGGTNDHCTWQVCW